MKYYINFGVIAIFLTLTIACGGGGGSDCEKFTRQNTLPFHINTRNDFFAREAVNAWNTGMGIEVFAEDDNALTIEYVEDINLANLSESVELAILEPSGATTFSCTENGSQVHSILVVEGAPSAIIYSTIAHELGHALGLDHTTFGIMQPSSPFDDIEGNIAVMRDYFFEIYPEYRP